MERNLLLTIQYDGSGYHGWQVQENARSVQGVFQEALRSVLGTQPDIKSCSRTDTGVHAREFCISMKLDHGIPAERLPGALNHFLPPDIAVLGCRQVPPDFHARYSCRGKRYVYEIWNHPVRNPFLRGRALHYYHPIDAEKLDAAAQHFIGRHDFTSFCTLDKREMGDFSRTVTESRVTRDGDMVRFTVAADGFLYNMVRIMTGTLLGVQQGRFAPADIPEILRCRDRSRAGATAPACGLYLQKVFYDLPPQTAGNKGMIQYGEKRKFFKRQAGRHAAAPETQPDLQETELPESGGPDAPDAVEHPALQKAPPPRVSKAVYKIAAVLLAAIVVLLVIENWENLTPGNIGNWIRTKAVGLGFGDGYPAELVGSAADAGNFGVNGGNVYVVSDTALTVMNSSAKTLFTARHSYNNPAVSAASDRYLLYNMGGTGYQVETVSGTQVSGTSENGDITTGVIADSGKFALALQPADMASQLCVYNKDGSLQYQYNFADTYINAVALNSDGTRGAVASVTSRNGSLVTRITVLDFSETEPIAEYESENNLVLGLTWTADNRVLAVGDQAALVSDGSFAFESCSYDGRTVTSYCLTDSRAVVSVFDYAYGGDSTLLIFGSSAQPVEAALPGRAAWLSSSGSKVAALLADRVVSVDLTTGRVEAACEDVSDTKGIAMGDESTVYMLGVQEIRKEILR